MTSVNPLPLRYAHLYQAAKYGVLTVSSFNSDRDEIFWLRDQGVVSATHREHGVTVYVPLNNVIVMGPAPETNPPSPPAPTRGRQQAA